MSDQPKVDAAAEGPKAKGDVTRLLAAVRRGDGDAMDRLFECVYSELRGIAHLKLCPTVRDLLVCVVNKPLRWINAPYFTRFSQRQNRLRQCACATAHIQPALARIDSEPGHKLARNHPTPPAHIDFIGITSVPLRRLAHTYLAAF